MKMYHYYHFRRDEFLTHYHKRSNAESRFSMIKAKFGDRIRSKTDTAQVNEVLLKILCPCVLKRDRLRIGRSQVRVLRARYGKPRKLHGLLSIGFEAKF